MQDFGPRERAGDSSDFDFILAIGDERTDEDMFDVLQGRYVDGGGSSSSSSSSSRSSRSSSSSHNNSSKLRRTPTVGFDSHLEAAYVGDDD